MTKTIPEITDEMIERASEAAYEADGRCKGDWATCTDTGKKAWRAFISAALTAALAPEPEIEVTEAMLSAAHCTVTMSGGAHVSGAFEVARYEIPTAKASTCFASIYRAMAKAAPKGAKFAPQGVSAGAPEKATGGEVGGLGSLGIEQNPSGGVRFSPGTRYSLQLNCMVHRRSTDPDNGIWKINRRSTDPK